MGNFFTFKGGNVPGTIGHDKILPSPWPAYYAWDTADCAVTILAYSFLDSYFREDGKAVCATLCTLSQILIAVVTCVFMESYSSVMYHAVNGYNNSYCFCRCFILARISKRYVLRVIHYKLMGKSSVQIKSELW